MALKSRRAAFDDRERAILLATVRALRDKFPRQADLAAAIGVTQPSLSHMLRGTWTPSVAAARGIAKAAGKPLHELLGRSEAIDDDAPPSSAGPENLNACVRFFAGVKEWSPWTLCAARAGYWPDDVPPPEWERRLDLLEAGLAALRSKSQR